MSKSSKLRTAALPAKTIKSTVDISLQDYVSMLDAVPYGFVLVDKMGFIHACNAVGRVMFQYRNIDVIGMPVDELLCKSDADSFLENLQTCLQLVNTAANNTSLQAECLKKDGTTFSAEIYMKIICLSGRELIGCTFRDISRRRCNENAIRKQEKKLQLVLQGAELWNWEYDCRSQVISYEIQNTKASGLIESNFHLDFERWVNLIYPDDKKAVMKSWSTLLADEPDNFEFEYRLKRTGGHWDWIYSCEHEVQRDNDGQPVKVCGTNLNISERKHAEERLQEKNASLLTIEKRLRLAQESSGVASWEWDMELKCIVYCSDNFADQCGLKSSEKVSSLGKWFSAIHPDDRERVIETLD